MATWRARFTACRRLTLKHLGSPPIVNRARWSACHLRRVRLCLLFSTQPFCAPPRTLSGGTGILPLDLATGFLRKWCSARS
jgi:hypothetical protein